MKKFSILRKLQLYMLGFGIAMGIVFPIYANLFVEWKKGMIIYFIIGCLFAGLMVGLVGFWFVKIILLKKLKDIASLANDIQNKNINKILEIESNDDVGVIVSGLNKAIINIRELFGQMNSIFSISKEALSSVKNSNDETSALYKISNAIASVTESTQKIEKFSSHIHQSVERGVQITNSTLGRQTNTITYVDNFSQIISSLVLHSERISDILKIIKNIADKIDILSINASIESGHAGEAGKGFAVVAGEIRKLATDTNESSKIISQTIQSIQDNVKSANAQVEIIKTAVNENSRDVDLINTQFSNIDKTINLSIGYNNELAQSVKDLNVLFTSVQSVFNELNKNIGQLQNIVVSYNY